MLISKYKKMTNSRLETEKFLKFILKISSKSLVGKEKRNLESDLKNRLGTRKHVHASTFFDTINLLNLDIDSLCEKLFNDDYFKEIDFSMQSGNKLKDFLSIYTRDVTSVAHSAGIENSRLNRLLSGEFKHLYPDEVYGLAKAFRVKPSQLFEYFYGDGERPVVGI